MEEELVTVKVCFKVDGECWCHPKGSEEKYEENLVMFDMKFKEVKQKKKGRKLKEH